MSDSAAKRYAEELKAWRALLSLTQKEFADRIGHSLALVAAVEQCVRAPSPTFAQACDVATGAPGTFETPPMVRWVLFQSAGRNSKLLQTEHHLIHDGISAGVLVGDILEGYDLQSEGIQLSGHALKGMVYAPQYAEYLDRVERERRFYERWAHELAAGLDGRPLSSTIPPDHERPRLPSRKGDSVDKYLDPRLVEKLRRMSRDLKCTPFSLLLVAAARALEMFNGQSTQVLGCGLANRHTVREWNTVGMMINVLPLAVELDSVRSGVEVLGQVTSSLSQLQEKSGLPISELVRTLGVGGNAAGVGPYYQVMLGEYKTMSNLELRSGHVSQEVVLNGGSKADLNIIFFRSLIGKDQEKWSLSFEYDSALYERATIARFSEALVDFLERIP